MSLFVYNAAVWVSQFVLLPLYCHIKATGLENIPMTGPLIIASNHLNDADPGIISTRIRRRIVFMTKDELFRVPGLGQFLTAFGAFPVRRNQADLAALRLASQALEQDLALCIFPEGTRAGETASLREAWPGAGLLALRNDVTVLPIAITGSQHMAIPKLFLRLDRRYPVTLTIGKPFRLEKPARIDTEAAKAATHQIMEHIAALLPPAYRGYYGSDESHTDT